MTFKEIKYKLNEIKRKCETAEEAYNEGIWYLSSICNNISDKLNNKAMDYNYIINH